MRDKDEFSIVTSWGARIETPEELAARAVETFRRLRSVHPSFDDWDTEDEDARTHPLDIERDAVASHIKAGVSTDAAGRPLPQCGYLWGAYNAPSPELDQDIFRFGVSAGSDTSISNNANFGAFKRPRKTQSIVDFGLFRNVLLALAEPFDAQVAYAYPASLVHVWPQGRQRKTLNFCWMSYLSPSYAGLVKPPCSAIVERRPAGGLLMSATDEVFDSDNPNHLAVAREIETAAAPFNALPWPPKCGLG